LDNNELLPDEIPSRRQQHPKKRILIPPLFLDVAFICMAIAGLISLGSLITRVDHLEKRVEELEGTRKELTEEANAAVTLKKWAGCKDKEVVSGKKYEFIWETLECVERPLP
jgi:hypothetical protein